MANYSLGYMPYGRGIANRWEFAESDGYVNGARDQVSGLVLSKAGSGTLTRVSSAYGYPAGEYAVEFPGGSGGPYLTGSIPVSGDFTVVVVANPNLADTEVIGPAATGSLEFYNGTDGNVSVTLRDPTSGNDVTATCAFGSQYNTYYFMAARLDQANKRLSAYARYYGTTLQANGVNGAGPWQNSFSSITVSCAYYGSGLTYSCLIDTLRVYNRLLSDSELDALASDELYLNIG